MCTCNNPPHPPETSCSFSPSYSDGWHPLVLPSVHLSYSISPSILQFFVFSHGLPTFHPTRFLVSLCSLEFCNVFFNHDPPTDNHRCSGYAPGPAIMFCVSFMLLISSRSPSERFRVYFFQPPFYPFQYPVHVTSAVSSIFHPSAPHPTSPCC